MVLIIAMIIAALQARAVVKERLLDRSRIASVS